MIAITGANGKLGKATIYHLMRRMPPMQIIAIVRDPAKASELHHAGVQVRKASYDDTHSLQQALQGAQQLLQISTTSIGATGIEQEYNVVKAAAEQGVQHIIYTSSLAPQPNAFFLPVQQALQTEAAIRTTGIPYTFFRNSLYMEAIPELIGNAGEAGAIYYPAGRGKVSFVSRSDIAAALANVLCGTGHENKEYEITGEQAYSFQEVAAMLRIQKSDTLNYVNISEEVYRGALASHHLPPEIINLLISMAAGIRSGEFAYTDDTLERLLQRKRTALTDYLKTYAV